MFKNISRAENFYNMLLVVPARFRIVDNRVRKHSFAKKVSIVPWPFKALRLYTLQKKKREGSCTALKQARGFKAALHHVKRLFYSFISLVTTLLRGIGALAKKRSHLSVLFSTLLWGPRLGRRRRVIYAWTRHQTTSSLAISRLT